MRSGIMIAMGIISLLCATVSRSEDLPILPSPAMVAKLPKPSGFTSSAARQLARSPAESTSSQSLLTTGTMASQAPIAFVSIDAALLRAPSQAGDRQEILVVGSARPEPGPLTLQFDDRSFDLAWVSETNERTRAVRHESMQVLNVPNGYARFSISGDDVVGTIVTPRETYRIVPAGPARQAVFRIPRQSDDRTAFQLEQQLPAAAAGAALERRHVQLEKLAEIQPEYVTGSDIGRALYIRGGSLGKIAGPIDARKTLALLKAVEALANVPSDLQIQIVRVGTQSSGQQIQFRQIVNGVPYFAQNEIHIDRDGNVTTISTQFVDPGAAGHASLLPQSAAQAQAVKALEQRFSIAVDAYELIKPTELFYYFEPLDQQLVAYYTFYIRSRDTEGAWAIRVDTRNGAARVLERPKEFGWRACLAATSTAPQNCSDAGADLIFYHTYNNPNGPQLGQCAYPRDPGNPNGKCVTPDLLRVMQAMNEANVVLHTVQQTNPTVCCDQIGGTDHIVDVVAKTAATTELAVYDPASESIMSNPSSDYLRNFDVVWHEFGHHVLLKNATSFDFRGTYGQSGEFFTSAFVEAMGDLMSAAISMNARQTTKDNLGPGLPWVVGDGNQPPPGLSRNLADPSITNFYHLSSSNSPHEAGRALSRLFSSIFELSGMTGPRFTELLLQVARNIRDVDQNRLDLLDVKTALLASARPGETALINAINNRFDVMYNNIPGVGGSFPPIGVPVQPGAPPAPSPVTATFTGNCPIVDGARTSEWRVQWAPSPFAVSYRVFGQQVNGPLTDVATTPSTFVHAQTNVNAVITVAACGASGLCGGSSVRVAVSMRSECNF